MRIPLLIVLLLACFPAVAATKYVRTDGGTATQCTGLADVAYDGAGTGEACAYSHPHWALGVRTGVRRYAAGDTIIIGNGTYNMGSGAGNGDQTGCASDWSDGCYTLAVLSGSSGAPTRILGADYATGCKSKPLLRGTGGNAHILSLVSADWVDVSCLDLSDADDCIYNHPNIPCASAPPLGGYTTSGIVASDSDNINLTDLNIHGFSNHGIHAGRLSNWSLLRVRIAANGFTGWNGDFGAGTSSNSGTMTFKNVEIAWNGCSENYPSTAIVQCWGQISNGYGDGVGTEATGGVWLFEDSWVHHNTSDGIDLLYVNEAGGTVTIRRTRAYANAGQQLKTNGDSVLIESNYVSGYCSYFFGRFGALMPAGDTCRASGNAISSTIQDETGVVLTIRYNTITGEGDTLLLLRNDTAITTDNAIVNIENNVLYGQVEWANGDQSLHFFMFNVTPTVNWRSNSVFNVKSGTCPATSTCTSPSLSNVTIANFDPRPLAGSYLRNSGNTTYPTPSADVNGRARPQETTPTRGAIEYTPGL